MGKGEVERRGTKVLGTKEDVKDAVYCTSELGYLYVGGGVVGKCSSGAAMSGRMGRR